MNKPKTFTELLQEIRQAEASVTKPKSESIKKLIKLYWINPIISGGLLSVVLPYNFIQCYILSLAIIWLIASGINVSDFKDKE